MKIKCYETNNEYNIVGYFNFKNTTFIYLNTNNGLYSYSINNDKSSFKVNKFSEIYPVEYKKGR